MKWIDRHTFGIWYFGFFLFSMGIRYGDGLLLSQLFHPIIYSPRIDSIVWTFHAIGLSASLNNSIVFLLFDSSLVLLALYILLRLVQRLTVQKLVSVHFIVFFFYILLAYTYPTLSLRKYLGLVLIPIAFTFKSQQRYIAYIKLMRYLSLFIFASAAIWKIARGVFLSSEHFLYSLKVQHIETVINFSDSWISIIPTFLLAQPELCTILFITAIVLQLSFIVGYFTYKYDKVLMMLFIVFVATDFFVMRIEFYEILVFIPLYLHSDFVNVKKNSY